MIFFLNLTYGQGLGQTPKLKKKSFFRHLPYEQKLIFYKPNWRVFNVNNICFLNNNSYFLVDKLFQWFVAAKNEDCGEYEL